ncbi:hypothetical protein [Desulfatitalea alkaliphila]|uniref:Uncharacterized protein n=1 Tax=Desulfatitalea alkaliphila TaxID=2929485 RepID=A0AA41UM16_9BACT|nr:hypothetical protein [Desulfatitalea alkaliphila]MCJ8502977.1 hypothetical protein [Desulfatitalea alkaliphila]
MSIVTLVGIVAGGLLILTAVVVFLLKKEFPAGGIMVTLIGLVLIGMSQWTTIKVAGPGFDLELLRDQIMKTAAATEEVAEQVQQAVAGFDATKVQIANLTEHLQARAVLAPADAVMIRQKLDRVPQIDVNRLKNARTSLRRIAQP